jgi:hypothetical protein
MMHRRVFVQGPVAFVCVSLLLAACGGKRDQDQVLERNDRIGTIVFQNAMNKYLFSCMKRSGFTYIIDANREERVRDSLKLGTEDFVKSFGYGITTYLDPNDPAGKVLLTPADFALTTTPL